MSEGLHKSCSFCGKKKEEVGKLIVSDQVAICSECVELCQDLLHNDDSVDIKKNNISERLDPRKLKEFLDQDHGNYKYPKAVNGKRKKARCKPSELLIAPDGRLFRCHYDLYHGVNSYGHILDEEVSLPTDFLPCDNMGLCNPCDIKCKFNRFQELGHCAVTIKEIK